MKPKVSTKADRYGLMYVVTVEAGGCRAVTTMATRPTIKHPTVKRLIRALTHGRSNG